MGELAIIIGNGFDLDLGLPSRYSDFIKSPEWQAVVKHTESFLYDESYREHSLVGQLLQTSKESLWFDIEEEIYQFVLSQKELTRQALDEVKCEFSEIKKALADYLKRVSKELEHKADKNRLAYNLLYNMQGCPLSKTYIYYNYTTPTLFLERTTYHEPGKAYFTYVHGSLRNDDIVLGCYLQEGDKVNRQLSFMYKYNQLHNANHVARSIMDAKEVIFFGHSLNEMDFGYFREFFKAASAAPNPIRHLTIITYDEQSERDIKDNIRNQGISVTDLYSNLWTFSVIHTQKVYQGDENEKRAWDNMLMRLLTKDRKGI